MTRKKNETDNEAHAYTEEDAPKLPIVKIEMDTHTSNLMAINQQFGLEEYDRQRVISEARFYRNHAVESYIELGKRLIQMKENEPHGEWLNCLDTLNMGQRVAQRTMQATLKILNASSTTHFIEKVGNKTKMFELLIFDDDEIKELSEGETVAGIKLDDIECMSVSELRAAIRKETKEFQETKKIKEDIIASKDQKINELDQEIRKLKVNKAAEPELEVFKPIGTDELAAVQAITHTIIGNVGAELRFAIDRFFQAFGEQSPSRAMRLGVAHCLGQIITTFDDVAEAYQIQPETELEHAAENPAKADAAILEQLLATDEPPNYPEFDAFKQRMAAKPAGEPLADDEAEEGDFTQLSDE